MVLRASEYCAKPKVDESHRKGCVRVLMQRLKLGQGPHGVLYLLSVAAEGI